MYFSTPAITKAFTGLIDLDPSDGKSRKEKVSGLRYLFATSELLKSTQQESVNLAVGSEYRQKFIEAVGNVVKVGEDNTYTRDFGSEFDSKRDFQVGSNFFTTRLAASRSRDVTYPGRPAGLLLLSNEHVSLLSEMPEHIRQHYGLEDVKASLAIWLCRNENFGQQVSNESEHLSNVLREMLSKKYTDSVVQILAPSPSEIASLFGGFTDEIWSDDKADMLSLLQSKESAVTEPKTSYINVLKNDLEDSDPVLECVIKLLERGSKGILFSGPPGTSKSWYALKIATKVTNADFGRVERVQFHPAFSYEDFIEGLVSTGAMASEKPLFEPKKKIFLNLCERAKGDPDNQYILIIDEFTRGDPSKIFGELLTFIESDYRDLEFQLPYSEDIISIPHNVIIFATMNPYDKSVTDLDAAMERRFEVVELLPDTSILKSLVKANGIDNSKLEPIIRFFNRTNSLSPHGFGHTYFKDVGDDQDLILLWNHKLKFILEKMFRFSDGEFQEVRQLFSEILDEESKEKMK